MSANLEGTVLGRCRLVRKVGQGGMGAVYLARHQTLDKDVAVKILPAEKAGKDFVQRFLREAKAAARLEHPNIIQVLDAGSEGGQHYIVMQFVQGNDLEKIIRKKGTVSVQDALAITKKTAQALSSAHGMGLVHRDIKPANIMITNKGKVMVSDFGLARDMNAGATVTSADQIVGTPHFLSPEQAKGDKVDHRSDLYSLGGTLYAMLTGKPPFSGPSALSIVVKHASRDEHPDPIPESNPDVPGAVIALVERMMEKNPEDRFQSADEVVAEIDRVRGAGDTMVRVQQSAVLTPKRKRGLLIKGALAGLGVLFALIVLVGILGRGNRIGRAYQNAVDTPRTEARLERLEAFVKKFPDSPEAEEAVEMIRSLRPKLAFEKAQKARTPEERIALLEELQETFPDSPEAKSAAKRIPDIREEMCDARCLEIREMAKSGEVPFKEMIRIVDAVRAEFPEASERILVEELPIHKARVIERTRKFGRLIREGKQEDIIQLISPVFIRERGEPAVKALAKLTLAGLTAMAGEIARYEVDEKDVVVRPRRDAMVTARVTLRNIRTKEERGIDMPVGWEWVEGDWYLKQKPQKDAPDDTRRSPLRDPRRRTR